jgi:hypothetical protein
VQLLFQLLELPPLLLLLLLLLHLRLLVHVLMLVELLLLPRRPAQGALRFTGG